MVKVVALLAMTILDRQDEHKEESISCCRDFPCNSRNPFPYLNAVSSPLRLTRYLKHLACREVSLSRASRAHTMTEGGEGGRGGVEVCELAGLGEGAGEGRGENRRGWIRRRAGCC